MAAYDMSQHGWIVYSKKGRWRARVPGYRGVDTVTWWPLQNLNRKDMATEVVSIADRMDQVLLTIPTGAATVCSDLDLVDEYLTACRKAGLLDTSTLYADAHVHEDPYANSHGPADQSREALIPLGIDVTFPSGDYSFINGVYLPQNTLLVDFIDKHRNEFGLFRSFADATRFMALHSSLERDEGLEPLSDALPILLSVRSSDL
jgi:hypothetical protein